jgi:hypothetical protein
LYPTFSDRSAPPSGTLATGKRIVSEHASGDEFDKAHPLEAVAVFRDRFACMPAARHAGHHALTRALSANLPTTLIVHPDNSVIMMAGHAGTFGSSEASVLAASIFPQPVLLPVSSGTSIIPSVSQIWNSCVTKQWN